MSAVYLDASAFVKLVIEADESRALQDFLGGEQGRHLSSSLLRAEVLRATAKHGQEALGAARAALQRIDLVAIDGRILDGAGLLPADVLRSLDAIHLATAMAIGDDLDIVVTYDQRMIKAASLLGLPTATPI